MNEQNLLHGCQTYGEVKFTELVYSWGRNEDGELAVSASKFASLPLPIKGFRGIVKEVASARTHTAIINNEGHIYMSGSLLFGKIGITAQVNNFRQFHFHSPMAQYKVKKVACGDYHTLALTEQGVLYSWGGSLWDKTGHKGGGIHKIERLVGHQIIDIACGDFHSLALNSAGQVYSWGGGGQNKNKGQLGHSNKKDLPHPELIQFFKGKKVIKIACGDYHTMVLTKDDQLYAFGQGNFGQLGTGAKEDASTPKKVALNFAVQLEDYFASNLKQQTRVQQIALGGKHSLILTNKGHIYVCGYGSQGQLGLNTTQNKYEPVLVQSLLGKTIKMVAAGANHSLCVTERGDVYCCGYNAKGQLGLGDERSVTSWTHVSKLKGMKVIKIFAGGDHSWSVIDELNPYITDYEPPSPIKINIEPLQPKLQPQQPQSQPQTISTKKLNDEVVYQPMTNRKLQLIVTQTQLSHRFIHFQLRDKQVKNIKPLIDSYIEAVRKTQGDNLKFYKLNQDGDIYDNQGQLSLPSNPKGMTIMLVSQLPENAREHLSSVSGRSKIAIGELMMMSANMLKIDGKVPSHNFWFFKFCSMFEQELEKVRFVELRPKRQ